MDVRPELRLHPMDAWLPSQIGKFLMVAGIALAVLGLLVIVGSKLSFLGFGSFGQLPGDIAYKSKNLSFYFPIVSCLVLSAVLTLLFWLISFLTRK